MDELGVSADKIAELANDRDTVQWLANAQEAYGANGSGLRAFRDNSLFGEKGDAVPVAPVFVMPNPPTTFSKQIIERLLDLVEDIEDADAYSPDIGAQLGIVPAKAESLAPDDWTTKLKGKILPAMQLEIDFKIGEADGISLQIQYVGEESWENGGNFPKRPAILTVTPKLPNTPQAVRIRGRLLKGNSPAGRFSDTINLVAAP